MNPYIIKEANSSHGRGPVVETTIKATGFGLNVAEVKLHFTLLYNPRAAQSEQWCVYVFHGCPAHFDWWLGRKPISRHGTKEDAAEVVDALTGIYGSADFFPVVGKAF